MLTEIRIEIVHKLRSDLKINAILNVVDNLNNKRSHENLSL